MFIQFHELIKDKYSCTEDGENCSVISNRRSPYATAAVEVWLRAEFGDANQAAVQIRENGAALIEAAPLG